MAELPFTSCFSRKRNSFIFIDILINKKKKERASIILKIPHNIL